MKNLFPSLVLLALLFTVGCKKHDTQIPKQTVKMQNFSLGGYLPSGVEISRVKF